MICDMQDYNFKFESIHTALSTNLESNLVLFDHNDAYVFNLMTQKNEKCEEERFLIELSDSTKVGNVPWSELKQYAMDPGFWKNQEIVGTLVYSHAFQYFSDFYLGLPHSLRKISSKETNRCTKSIRQYEGTSCSTL